MEVIAAAWFQIALAVTIIVTALVAGGILLRRSDKGDS